MSNTTPRPRPTDIGEILTWYRAGQHAYVRGAFDDLAPADAAGLAASIIEHAADRAVLVDHVDQLEAARVALDLCRYFRRWQA